MLYFLTSNTVFGRFLRWPLRLVPGNTRMWVLSGPLSGKRWIAGSSNHGCWLGIYERIKVLGFAKAVSRLPKDAVIYDFGAHVGIYSMIAAIQAPGRVVYAFEPVPENLKYLKEHLKLNGIQNVLVLPVVVGRTSKSTQFALGHSSTTGRVGIGEGLVVQQIQVDEEVNSGRIPPPSLIKMDIEGGEWEALQGAKETLRKFGPQVFLATHGDGVHHQCLKLLTELGYRCLSLNSQTIETTDEIYAYRSSGSGLDSKDEAA